MPLNIINTTLNGAPGKIRTPDPLVRSFKITQNLNSSKGTDAANLILSCLVSTVTLCQTVTINAYVLDANKTHKLYIYFVCFKLNRPCTKQQ